MSSSAQTPAAFGGDSSSCALTCTGNSQPTTGIAPLSVHFVGTATSEGCTGSVQWVWSFGDGGFSGAQQAYHTFEDPGNYVWTLTGTLDGVTATDSGTVQVLPDPCRVQCSGSTDPTSGMEPLPVRFIADLHATDCQEPPVAQWDSGEYDDQWFGEDTGAIYPWAGTYWWTLTVVDRCETVGSVTVESPFPVPDEVGRWPYGRTLAVGRSGDLVIFGEGSALTVADASDPFHPVRLGSVELPDTPLAIAIQGLTAFVADDGAGLRIVDFTNPHAPYEMGHLDTADWAMSLSLSGSTLYLGCASALRVVDVSVPSQPQEISAVPHPFGLCGVAAADALVYLVASGRIHIFDASDPRSLREIGSLGWGTDDVWIGSSDIVVRSGYAYCLGADLDIVEVSNPATPLYLGYRNLDNYSEWSHLALSGCTLVVPAWGGSELIYGLENPASPWLVGRLDGCGALALDGARLAYSDRGLDLRMADLSDPANPVLQGSLATDSAPSSIAMQGNYAYLAAGPGGLKIFDLSSPGGITEVGSCRIGEQDWALDLAVEGSSAFLTTDNGLTILDVSDPASPRAIRSYPDPSYPDQIYSFGDLAVSGNTLCVAHWDNLCLLDVTDPAAAEQVGYFGGGYLGDWSTVVASGPYAYIGYGMDGPRRTRDRSFESVRILDISNPASPRQVGAFHGYTVESLAISGSILAVLSDDYSYGETLILLDVSNPACPGYLGSVVVPGWKVALTPTTAFVIGRGVRAVDITDPTNPAIRGYYPSLDSPRAVAAQGTRACVANYTNGVTLLDAAPCLQPASCAAQVSPIKGGAPLTVTFSAPAPPAASGNPPASFRWSLGDGALSSEREFSHTYAQPGWYTWSLTLFQGDRTCGRSGRIEVATSDLPGDCDGDGVVTVGEVQLAINMFLGTQYLACRADCDGDWAVSIGELQKVINTFLGLPSSC